MKTFLAIITFAATCCVLIWLVSLTGCGSVPTKPKEVKGVESVTSVNAYMTDAVLDSIQFLDKDELIVTARRGEIEGVPNETNWWQWYWKCVSDNLKICAQIPCPPECERRDRCIEASFTGCGMGAAICFVFGS
jgi:hypothetical protein